MPRPRRAWRTRRSAGPTGHHRWTRARYHVGPLCRGLRTARGVSGRLLCKLCACSAGPTTR
eukprot:6912409-Lingulodinium_polyedra.AAC.1